MSTDQVLEFSQFMQTPAFLHGSATMRRGSLAEVEIHAV